MTTLAFMMHWLPWHLDQRLLFQNHTFSDNVILCLLHLNLRLV